MMTTFRGVKKRDGLTRNKERASMSFFIVVMFFAVFTIIVVTEVLLMDERGRSTNTAGVLVRRGSLGVSHRRSSIDNNDYDDALQMEDYVSYRGGGVLAPEPINHFGNLIKDNKMMAEAKENNQHTNQHFIISPAHGLPVIGDIEIPNSIGNQPLPMGLEIKLPQIRANFTAKDGTWQAVNGTRSKFYVFSAFFDRRKGQKAIRIIGATRTRGPERVWCRFWYDPIVPTNTGNTSTYNHKLTSITVMAKVKVIRENWNLKYSACFVLCPLTRDINNPPQTVSIVSKLRALPVNRLIVRNTDSDVNTSKIQEGLAVCVKPLHFSYNQAIQMLEFLELNSLLGVQHFTFYNHTLGKGVGCILNEYMQAHKNNPKKSGSVGLTLLPWQLNMISQKEIRTEGLFAALNDCLYRSMYRYSHVALIDLDEYIIPKHNDTLQDLIKWMSSRLNIHNTGSYSFQNAFFYLQWGDDESIYKTNNRIEASLVTLRKTRRRSKLHPHKQRSKYICRPEQVIEAGNHFVWEFIPGHGTLNVPADAAILHHYRVCEFGGDDCIKTTSTVDRTTYRYREKLIKRVEQKYTELKTKCNLPDLPPIPTRPPTVKPKVVRILNPQLLKNKKSKSIYGENIHKKTS